MEERVIILLFSKNGLFSSTVCTCSSFRAVLDLLVFAEANDLKIEVSFESSLGLSLSADFRKL